MKMCYFLSKILHQIEERYIVLPRILVAQRKKLFSPSLVRYYKSQLTINGNYSRRLYKIVDYIHLQPQTRDDSSLGQSATE